MYSIVLVHIGDEFFEHINTHLEQLKKFNDCDIYLAISSKHFPLIKHNVKLVDIDTLEKVESHKKFLQIYNQGNFWSISNFWRTATERFFYIEAVMRNKNLTNVFHFEYDNMIYVNLEELLPIFEQNYYIAATFDNDNRCVPGFMYFKEISDLTELNKYILNSKDKNDMEIIAAFRNSGTYPINNLPILPNTYTGEYKSTTGLITKYPDNYTCNFDKFNSIFDAAAIGQFLGGISPRNNGGVHTKGFINESCIFNVSQFSYVWKVDNLNRKVPYLLYKGDMCRINNLHIHSKELQEFLS